MLATLARIERTAQQVDKMLRPAAPVTPAAAPGEALAFGEWYRRTLPPGFGIPRHIAYLCDLVQEVVDGRIMRLAVSLPPGHAKALADDTPIPTPQGFTNMGDLQPGDFVFGPDGQPTRVTHVWHWKDRPCYRVTTDDGHSVIADEAHEWLVRLDRKRPIWKVYETSKLATRTSPRRPLIPVFGALQLPEASLPIEPYTLGLWLGDGHSSAGSITASDDDREHAIAQVEADGYETGRPPAARMTFSIYKIRPILRALGVLWNKHIPPAYFRASYDQRLALLQGLMDSDGTIAPDGQAFYSGVNERLCRDVMALVHTLGAKASMGEGRARLNGKDCGTHYRVTFYMAGCARLPRKAARTKNGTRTPGRFLSFEKVENRDTTCITVEHPSHLFLAGPACIVTHNSSTITHRLPVYWGERHPGDAVVFTGYSQRFAEKHLSQQAREIARELGVLAPDASALDEWGLTSGARLVTRGVGNPPTGVNPISLLVCDDPIKSREEAASPTMRDNVWQWWTGSIVQRFWPRTRAVIIATRWHEADLIGRLREQEAALPPERRTWTFVNLPALALEGDPLGRAPGEALWPEAKPAEFLHALRAEMGAYEFEAVFQGNPTPREGSVFKVGALQYVDAADVPEDLRRCRAWDLAATEGGGDYTAGVLIGRSGDGYTYVLDVQRGQWDAAERNARLRSTAEQDGASVPVRLPQDPGQAGKEQAGALTRLLSGYAVTALPVSGSKEVRADPFAAQVNAGNVRVVRAAWTAAFVEELRAFPGGANDDQVDAAADAFAQLAGGRVIVSAATAPVERIGDSLPSTARPAGPYAGPMPQPSRSIPRLRIG